MSQSRKHIERIRGKYLRLIEHMGNDDSIELNDYIAVVKDGEKFFALLEYEDAIDNMLIKYEPLDPLHPN